MWKTFGEEMINTGGLGLQKEAKMQKLALLFKFGRSGLKYRLVDSTIEIIASPNPDSKLNTILSRENFMRVSYMAESCGPFLSIN